MGSIRQLIAEADKRKPDLAIVIDSPAFNWRVARQMKKRGIPDGLLRCTAILGVAAGPRTADSRVHRQSSGDFSRSKKSSIATAAWMRPSSDILWRIAAPTIERGDYAAQFILIPLSPGSPSCPAAG